MDVAMYDGERITSNSYCHERPGYNDSLRAGLSWVRTPVGERGFMFPHTHPDRLLGLT